MEQEEKIGTLPLNHIRGLVVRQDGRCAITGLPLEPADVNADHIVPLSRTKLSPSRGKNNVWIVHRSVNAMKGTMTYDELVQMARLILDNHQQSLNLLAEIQKDGVKPLNKVEFDKWVETKSTPTSPLA